MFPTRSSFAGSPPERGAGGQLCPKGHRACALRFFPNRWMADSVRGRCGRRSLLLRLEAPMVPPASPRLLVREDATCTHPSFEVSLTARYSRRC